MPQAEDHEELKKKLEENTKVLKENNEMLRKLYHWTVAGLVLRFVWIALIIGLPFALYFYILEPYFEAFGSNFELFKEGLNELPGLKGIDDLINRVGE